MQHEFIQFGKISRYSRDVIVSEKIDGTNAQIFISEDGQILTGSRTRWITPEDDNHGFAKWVEENKEDILKLGAGRHFGEWWGSGIQRGYGLKEKKFSLFNVTRWCLYGTEPKRIETQDPRIEKCQEVLPKCCGLVPVLWQGKFENFKAEYFLGLLKAGGSQAAPGYMKPEGIVIFHTAGNVGFKMTIEKDDLPKGGIK